MQFRSFAGSRQEATSRSVIPGCARSRQARNPSGQNKIRQIAHCHATPTLGQFLLSVLRGSPPQGRLDQNSGHMRAIHACVVLYWPIRRKQQNILFDFFNLESSSFIEDDESGNSFHGEKGLPSSKLNQILIEQIGGQLPRIYPAKLMQTADTSPYTENRSYVPGPALTA
ncbi:MULTISPECIES: hypothetical protein [Bradyrhizobium]|uniref:Uncharacterized protein n=1 Tax=Bradyrhizobium diazoefficiens TaxID=1355477 RepID=A0A809X3W6_9BRAD|nr:hypothetical protein [Bradyrhizobium diazoefficiens]MBP1065916.1 hypothetical protein [Bradyrhizobium japonicum]QJS40977.1 hypothetical protein DI395_45985 [Bradyrhizobium diazoefficiens]QLD44180.1 hypothetical protein HUW42_25740 [Bradyrhizobium diazoefficiens]WLA70478.1 hypothetical protein QIH77_26650 [Bradyrhizobium diazoefficiens]WLB42330.1 hypothetical protein QIH78_21810 [Bradyrhizobium diazoefficiens]